MSDDRSQQMSGREAAYRAVLNVLTRQTFVNETLGRLRDGNQMDRREAGLATEIAMGTIRHLFTIESVFKSVATFDPQRVQPEIKAVLYSAGYQAIWMDRVPLFAAVNEAVALAHRFLSKRASGMVNAILRCLTKSIGDRRTPWIPGADDQVRIDWTQACKFSQPVVPPTEPDVKLHLAVAAGERVGRLNRLINRHGFESASQIVWASQAVPSVILQRNVASISESDFETRIADLFGDQAEIVEGAAFVSPGVNVIETDLFRDGLVYVQDSTAQFAASLVAAAPGERILDLCAAPGGKSMAMAGQMGDRGEVVACDVAPGRLVQVSANADRLGLQCVRTHLLDLSTGDMSLEGMFDAAIVDVPCSNTGVIARRPEARLGFTSQKVESLTRLQSDILRRAAECVKPGGRLIYSTCCLEPGENDAVTEGFLAESPEWSRGQTRLTLPNWGARLGEWRDGGYASRLEKKV